MSDSRMPDSADVRPLLTVGQVAEWLQRSPNAIYRDALRGRIPFIRVGHSLRFRPEDIERWLDDQANKPRPGGL